MAYVSTVNPAIPAQGSASASAPIRGNFAAAQTDINALSALIAANPLTGAFSWTPGSATAIIGNIFTWVAPFSGTITGLKTSIGPNAIGSILETITIGGVAVSGLTGVTCNAVSPQSFTATGANTFMTGQIITFAVVVISGSPVGSWASLQYTQTGP